MPETAAAKYAQVAALIGTGGGARFKAPPPVERSVWPAREAVILASQWQDTKRMNCTQGATSSVSWSRGRAMGVAGLVPCCGAVLQATRGTAFARFISTQAQRILRVRWICGDRGRGPRRWLLPPLCRPHGGRRGACAMQYWTKVPWPATARDLSAAWCQVHLQSHDAGIPQTRLIGMFRTFLSDVLVTHMAGEQLCSRRVLHRASQGDFPACHRAGHALLVGVL